MPTPNPSFMLIRVEELAAMEANTRADALRMQLDQVIEKLEKDVTTYGFDISKFGTPVVTLGLHDMKETWHRNMLQPELQRAHVWNLFPDLKAGLNSCPVLKHECPGVLQRMNFSDGRHRLALLRAKYSKSMSPVQFSMSYVLVKMEYDISRNDARLISLREGRMNAKVDPCISDQMACFPSPDSDPYTFQSIVKEADSTAKYVLRGRSRVKMLCQYHIGIFDVAKKIMSVLLSTVVPRTKKGSLGIQLLADHGCRFMALISPDGESRSLVF